MAEKKKLSFATTWINTFTKPCSVRNNVGPLEHCDEVANGFGEMMKLGGHKWAIDRKEDTATPADWAKPRHGVDTVDFAIIVSHGYSDTDYVMKVRASIYFYCVCFNREPCRFCSHKMRFGHGKLKWLIIDACESLEIDEALNYTPWTMWRQSFHGLHTIFGFNGKSTDHRWVSGRGQNFAMQILMDLPLAEAWIDSALSWICLDDPVAAVAGRDKKDAVNRCETEKISSSFDSIPNKEVKYIYNYKRERPPWVRVWVKES